QVGLPRGVAGQAYGGVGLAHVGQVGIGVGVDGHGLDAEAPAGAEDAGGDLGAVGHQQSGDPSSHGRNTPNRSVPAYARFSITDRQMPRTVRVSRGSMTPSS